ncbi:MAG: translation initiation factor IF-3 [Lentimicrobiaceae bacterium]|nr:translation initiation factor IF-3 [Lentimicrobiaceae bacterium]
MHLINQHITAPVVRLVTDGAESRILTLREALGIAREEELDLVEISPQVNPPVCKIMNYQKYIYDLKKKQKEIKAKAVKVSVKEIRLGPNTNEHDFNFKVKHAVEFLQEGNKVKVDIFFKGRSIMYKDQGELMMLNFAKACEGYGRPDQMPKLEGKRMLMMLLPLKKQ